MSPGAVPLTWKVSLRFFAPQGGLDHWERQESLKTVKTLSTRCLTPQEKREIAAEKFDILYAQGFCRTAETVLRKAIAVSSIELVQRKVEEEIWMHAVLKATMVLVMLHTTGKMDHLMQMRRELVELFLDRYHGPRNAVLVRRLSKSTLNVGRT
jgi:hypothetical protein